MGDECRPWAKKALWITIAIIIVGLLIYMIVFEFKPELHTQAQLEFNSRMFMRSMLIILSFGIGYLFGYKLSAGQVRKGVVAST